MIEWQPMETAPRDGTAILIYLDLPAKQAVGYGPSVFSRVVVGDLTGPSDYIIGPLGNFARATHWMPLPEPPEAEK